MPGSAPAGVRFDRAEWWSFALTTALALVVYGYTLAPDVTLAWSGILSTGAAYAGVSPPPGYPVWTIYSWFFIKLLPFSTIAWRVAAGSALAAALASGTVALMVSRAGRSLLEEAPAFNWLGPVEQRRLRGVCGCVAGLGLGFSGTLWREAVIADLWALTALLFALVLCLMLWWVMEPVKRRFVYAAFFVFGLLLTNSQELIVAMPGLACLILLADRKLGRDVSLIILPLAGVATTASQYSLWIDFPAVPNLPLLAGFVFSWVAAALVAGSTHGVGTEWKSALLCGLGLLLGLSVYFYLPIVSMTNPPSNWGYARTVQGFVHLVSRGQYERPHPTGELGLFAQQLWMNVKLTGREIGWPYLILSLLSFCYWHRISRFGRTWILGLLAVWICVGPLLLAMLNFPEDRQAQELMKTYFAASYVVLAVWAGLGLTFLGATLTKPREEKSLP